MGNLRETVTIHSPDLGCKGGAFAPDALLPVVLVCRIPAYLSRLKLAETLLLAPCVSGVRALHRKCPIREKGGLEGV